MYGWLEAGRPSTFKNASKTDIVLRTTFDSSKLIIGNSSNADLVAAMYVTGNNVGIHCTPNADYPLDVHGPIHCDNNLDIFNAFTLYKTQVTSSNISQYHNYTKIPSSESTSHGLLKNKAIISDNVKKPILTVTKLITNIEQRSIINPTTDLPETGYIIEMTANKLEDVASPEQFMSIKNTLFRIIDFTIQDPTIVFQVLIPIISQSTDVLPFTIGETVSVEILEDVVSFKGIGDYSPFTKLNITSQTFSEDLNTMQITAYTLDYSIFTVGTLYNFKTSKNRTAINEFPTNICILENIIIIDNRNITLTFKSIDPAYPILNMLTLLPSMYVFRLESLMPSSYKIVEPLAYRGYYDQGDGRKYMFFQNTDLVANTMAFPRNSAFNIKALTIDQASSNPSSISRVNDYVIVDFEEQPNALYAGHTALTYRYQSAPIQITHAEKINEHTISYRFSTTIPNFISYISKYTHAYVSDVDEARIWKINNATPFTGTATTYSGSLELFTLSQINDGQFIQLIKNRTLLLTPFKQVDMTQVGDTRPVYIPTQLCINTNTIKETLTVNGNASIVDDLFIYNDESTIPFNFHYSSNVLNVNNAFQINTLANTVTLAKTMHIADDAKLAFSNIEISATSINVSNTKLTVDSVIDTDVVISNSALKVVEQVLGIQIIKSGQGISVDSSYKNQLLCGDVLKINNHYYKIVTNDFINGRVLLALTMYLKQDATFIEIPDQVTNVTVLRDTNASLGMQRFTFDVVEHTIYENTIRLRGIMEAGVSSFLIVNNYFSVSPNNNTLINNAFELVSVVSFARNEFALVFKTIENNKTIDILTGQLYIYPLDTFYTKVTIIERNIPIGFRRNGDALEFAIPKTTLKSIISEKRVSAMNSIQVNSTPYSIDCVYYEPLSDMILLQIPADTTMYTQYADTLEYQLNGIPLQVINAILVKNNTIRYTLTAIPEMLSSYIGSYVYIIDRGMWFINDISMDAKTMTIVTQDSAYVLLDKKITLFAIPFQLNLLNLLGNGNYRNYTKTSLGIGTGSVKETLTVGGDASIKNTLNIYDGLLKCQVEFRQNTLRFIGQTSTNINGTTVLTGDLLTNNVYQAADSRLQRDIVVSDNKSDLDMLMRLPLVNFMNDGRQKKGVLAQDVELLMPEYVLTHDDGYKSVDYQSLFALTMGAVKELASSFNKRAQNLF